MVRKLNDILNIVSGDSSRKGAAATGKGRLGRGGETSPSGFRNSRSRKHPFSYEIRRREWGFS